ncbi:MAG: protein kinase [Planctomycetota bacterium]|nr:protein kinase [Planctomycetota bacterium]
MASGSSNVPKAIGGFEIIERIGQGAMGSVFKARQVSLDRVVALKILPPKIAADRVFIERFQREARASARLNHPNIVLGIDVGRDEATGLWYFAMEFVDGPSLKDVLARDKKFSEGRALRVMLDVARALECAERQQMVHRDIKPDNILLAKSGEAKLADLGLAKKLDDEEAAHLTQSGRAVGTPHYMAPEQARGASDAFDVRTDLYACGATLFHLVTGRTPFQAATPAAVMAMHLTEKPPPANSVEPGVSDGCAKLIAKLMEKKPEKRVQSATEFAEQLEELLAGPGATGKRSAVRPSAGRSAVRAATTGPRVPIRGVTTGPRVPVSGRADASPSGARGDRNNNAVLLGAGAGVLLAVLLLVFVLGGKSEPPRAPKKVAEATEAPAEPRAPVPAPKTPAPPPVQEKTPEAAPLPVVEKHEPPPPAAKTEPAPAPEPARPEPPKPDPEQEKAAQLAAAKAKYEAFHHAFIEALRKGDAKAAGAQLDAAEKDPALAPLKDELALDRKAYGWPGLYDKSVQDGAAKLAGGEPFELKLAQGPAMKVGKGAEFQVTEVKDGTLYVGSKGMAMPVALAKLHPETRRALAEAGLPGGEGQVAAAFVMLLDAAAPDAVAERLSRAAAANAAAAEIAYVKRELDRLGKELLESAAQAAWKDLEKAAAGEKWSDDQKKGVVKAVEDFRARHAATAFAKTKEKEIADLLARASLRGAEIPREGLSLWLRADAGVTLKDNAVVQWADQSGRNHHAVPTAPDQAPELAQNALGALPAVRFNGKKDHFVVAGLKGEMKSFSILWTLKPNSHSNYNQSFSAEGGWGQFVFHTTSDGSVFVGTSVPSRIGPGDGTGRDTVALNQWQQFAYVFDQGMAHFYKNGKLLAKKKLEPAAWTGFRLSGYDGRNTIDGEVSEFLIYERAVSDEERVKIEKHLLPEK